ncbi:MAG TPA: hypothetical protein P5017_06470 [Anaerohalosphaeraceae bacterium]|nr:hypothetical protein [Anaerohalosphaeraceae bacterium]
MAKVSPFQQAHNRLGAVFGEFDGWTLPSDFGDSQSEQDAILNHCAAVDLSSFGRICLKGSHTEILLQQADIQLPSPLSDGRWCWAVKNGDGRPGRLRIGKIGSEIIILTLPGRDKTLLAELKQISEKMNLQNTILDVSENTGMLGLYGPNAFRLVRQLLPFDLEDLQSEGVTRISLFMLNFVVFRGSWLDIDGLELVCPASAGPLAAGSIAKAREKYNITPAGMAAFREILKQKNLL